MLGRGDDSSASCPHSPVPSVVAQPTSNDATSIDMPITQAEAVSVFHYEILTLSDPMVAKKTTELLHWSIILILIAIGVFVFDLLQQGTSQLSASILNLIFALALPFCGIYGVRDRNITCLQYFCCFSYVCGFLTLVALISALIFLARGKDKYLISVFLLFALFAVYLRGGFVSQQLQAEPYFTNERLAPPRLSYTGESLAYRPQPGATPGVANASVVSLPGDQDGVGMVEVEDRSSVEAARVPTAVAVPAS